MQVIQQSNVIAPVSVAFIINLLDSSNMHALISSRRVDQWETEHITTIYVFAFSDQSRGSIRPLKLVVEVSTRELILSNVE